jgi:hypothetical protein
MLSPPRSTDGHARPSAGRPQQRLSTNSYTQLSKPVLRRPVESAKQHLNPERRHRTYPRVVKRARHNSYRVKRTSDQGIRHNRPPTIKLANLGSLTLAA